LDQRVPKLILDASTGGRFTKDFFAATGAFRGSSEGEAEGCNSVMEKILSNQ
jgi:hypothetical protein